MEATSLEFRYRITPFEVADEVTVEGEREHTNEELFGLNCHEGLKGAEGLHHRMSHFHNLRRVSSLQCWMVPKALHQRMSIVACNCSREYSTSNPA